MRQLLFSVFGVMKANHGSARLISSRTAMVDN